MRATIDQQGRLVIPKDLCARLGLVPGDVEVMVDGSALRVEPLAGDVLDEENGRLVIAARERPSTTRQHAAYAMPASRSKGDKR